MQIRDIHSELSALAKGGDVHWFCQRKSGYLLRLTNNYIHQSGYQDKVTVSIRVIRSGRIGLAETSDASRAGLARALGAAEKAAQVQEIELSACRLPVGSRASLASVKDFALASSVFSSIEASRKVKQSLDCVRRAGAHAHGYFSDYVWEFLAGNSVGLLRLHRSSGARFGLTVNRGVGSGYETFFHPDVRKIDFAEITRKALDHALVTEREIKIKPGRYPVILSPRAMAAFFTGFFEEWNGRKFLEKESFLIHYAKNAKKPLASSLWTINDDVAHPLQTGIPFDAEGETRKKVTLLRGGRFRNCVYDRWTAERFRIPSTGHALNLAGEEGALPLNVVVARGKNSLSAMIRKIRRGILIPNIWYHQIIEPSSWKVTGLTRGGAAWIEDGQIVGGLGRIRYMGSLLDALKCTTAMSREQYALKFRDVGALVFPYVQVDGLRIV